ncbi:MAG: FAD:protein FMN transferase [Gammaproteobacteria bacterium]|nr:FAD:protein FMN transferase [Gammaproteobacteria bacterium]MBU1978102.1 FAD:protein FMN transferase [Gammaproteobacteria bacterium]
MRRETLRSANFRVFLTPHPLPHPLPLAFLLTALVLLFALAGCTKEAPVYHEQSFVFGTMVDVTIAGEEPARARELASKVLADFDYLHRTLHAWEPGALSRMNAVFAQSPSKVAVVPGLVPIIQDATRLSEMSGGLFNPAIGKLIKLWGFQGDEFTPQQPDPKEIKALIQANPRMTDIVFEGILFYSKNPAVQLDLGGYAKGYALDLAAEYLRTQGVKGALINIGGNIIAIGSRGGQPWRVGVQHPRKAGAIASLELHDGEAIGTSGDYQRYFEFDGKRYCHIIDPRTGYPTQGVQAVTVLIPKGNNAGTLSDVASKPAFIAGVKGWRKAAQAMGAESTMLIDERGEVYLTAAMNKRLEFQEKGLVFHEVP